MNKQVGLIIKEAVAKALKEAAGLEVGVEEIKLEHPELEDYGDYATNIALVSQKQVVDKFASPLLMAKAIVELIKPNEVIAKVEVAGPGFVNIWLQKDVFINKLNEVLSQGYNPEKLLALTGKKVLVEYAHPNTHKEMHIGHMRTLITGEAVARLLEKAGAVVFRANYQGDIGPHVAKSIWGTTKLLSERNMTWEQAESMTLEQKAHLLGEGYVLGNKEYEANKEEIDNLNKKLYDRREEVVPVYERTRRWSLEYYDQFYQRFGTKFDKLFFESEMVQGGKEIVKEHTGTIFTESEGAVIFDGEQYDLHKRVFITAAGNPTYEGKEMANAMAERAAFEFDLKVHVVANEQAGYFQVIFKALELIDEWFVGKQKHLSMGMVNLIGRKISSRTGDIITVDGLLDEVKGLVMPMINRDNKTPEQIEKIAEIVTLGAVKYSVLRSHPTINVAFDLQQSVNLEGNSGPYLQYTYARTKSVLAKVEENIESYSGNSEANLEELKLLSWISRFSEVVHESASRYSPNLLCNHLFDLAQRYNLLYSAHQILNAETREKRDLRLALTAAVAKQLQLGLQILGIETVDKM